MSAPEPAPTPAPAPDPKAVTCPHCGTVGAPGALFCETCGYDFTTGSLPEETVNPLDLEPPAPLATPSGLNPPAPAAPPAPSGPVAGTGAFPPPPDPGTYSTATQISNPGATVTPPHPAAPAAPPAPPEVTTPVTGQELGEAQMQSSGPTGATAAPFPPIAATAEPSGPAEAAEGSETWVVEVWVDPDWYADQQASEPMPSVGPPGLVVLRDRSSLVGRPSASRGIHPEVDCGSDTGVSRRHCQLSTDGQRWWVEDLQSSNGTFVAGAGDPLPTTPLPPGERHELEEGDRIFLGAWTRLVVREALPGEA